MGVDKEILRQNVETVIVIFLVILYGKIHEEIKGLKKEWLVFKKELRHVIGSVRENKSNLESKTISYFQSLPAKILKVGNHLRVKIKLWVWL